MATIEELLATLQEDDPEAAKALQDHLTAAATEKEQAQKELARKTRDYDLATDQKYRERFPRAMMVFDKGRLTLEDELDKEALVKALNDKEEELAELGVPVPESKGASPPPSAPKAEAEKPSEEDPAKSWGEPIGGSPSTSAEDPVKDFWNAMRGTTEVDRRNAADALYALNLMGHGKADKPDNDKIKEIARQMAEDEFNRPIGENIW